MIQIYNQQNIFQQAALGQTFRLSDEVLILVEEGSVVVVRNGARVVGERGSGLLFVSGDVCTFEALSPEARFTAMVVSQQALLQQLNVSFNPYQMYRLLQQVRAHSLPPIAPQHFAQEILRHLLSAFVYIFGAELSQQLSSAHDSRKEQYAMDFLSLLSVHFREEHALEFYASKLCITAKYLSNTVREVTGVPPSRFIAEELLNEAKRQLLQTTDTVMQIADSLHFSGPYAFTKFFKNHTGVSPRTFRKMSNE